MSLRTRILVSIFVFMVLVLALLTLNLWLDVAARTQVESRRNAELVARLVSDLLRGSAPESSSWKDEEWAAFFRKLAGSDLIAEWTVAEEGPPGFRPTVSSDARLPEIGGKEQVAFVAALERIWVDTGGARVYVPLPGGSVPRRVARLGLKGAAVPAYDLADSIRGIVTLMGLGTALLLLNTYVFLNRLVLRPLRGLIEGSQRVALGDFSKKVSEEGRYDEMGRLIRTFNDMMEKVAGHHQALQEDVRRARGQVQDTERKLVEAQRLSTTGTLAAGIAHEINNPLGGMINAALSLKEGKLDEARRVAYLDLLLEGLDRVRAIVQKILQVRPRPFQPQPVRLYDAVDQVIAFLEHRARAKGVDVANEVPRDLPPVEGDPVELQQALLNILMNAVDACAPDGGGRVRVTGRQEAGRVEVAVSDNGHGMDDERMARCMDPFYTTKETGQGTGLGLAVANSIVSHHGGRIEIESAPGRGATFALSFPTMNVSASGSPIGRTG